MAFNWKKLIGTVAPTIARALGGPLAGMAVDAIAGAVGFDSKGKTTSQVEEGVAAIMAKADPQILLKLKKADHEFETKLKELDIDLEKIHQEDRSSARERQVLMKDQVPGWLALLLTLGFFGSLLFCLNMEVPKSNEPLIHVMLGSLGTAWISAMTYFFGSSAGSKRKDGFIEKMNGRSGG